LGIIIKQTIKGSIWSYLGVLIGFITTTYFYTEYLTPEIVGLFGLLVAISNITSGLASLGMNGVAGRLFPYFRSNSNDHNGFLFLNTGIQLIGFTLFLIFYFIFKENIVENNISKSPLFAEFVYLIIPLTIFTVIFNLLDTYYKLLYNAVLGTFLQEFLQRVFIFFTLVLYILKFLSLEQLIVAYAVAICFKGVLLLTYLFYKGKINLHPNLKFINGKLRREIIDVALFSFIGGLGSMIVFSIDKLVVNQLLDLSNTGVYTIAFYFGTLVIIPSRPLLKISSTLIAEAFAKDDVEEVKNIYYKSCINQFILGGFLFLGIWTNIDNILSILGDDYIQSKWVIFFVGIGYLFDMLTGANGLVISLSKYYRKNFMFIAILVLLVVGLLYNLIPLWGIIGAAIAIAIALFLNNLMRYFFLLRKYKMQPFNYKFLIVTAFYLGLYLLLSFIPQQELIIDILVRGTLICLFSALFLFFVPVSEDIVIIKKSLLRKLGM